MTVKSEELWRKGLKKDDLVVVSTRRGLSISKVSRATKTQIVLEESIGKFRISDGDLIGAGNWNTSQIIEPTKKIIDTIKKEKLIHILNSTDWAEFELEALVEITSVLKQSPKLVL